MKAKDNCIITYKAKKQITRGNIDLLGNRVVNHSFENGEGVIEYAEPIKEISDGFLQQGFSICEIDFPESVARIGDNVLRSCSMLKTFVLGKNVKFIGENFLRFTRDLASLSVEEGNPVFDSRGNCDAIIHTPSNYLIRGISWTTKIPKTVTKISPTAFGSANYPQTISVEDGNPVYDSRDNCNAVIETSTGRLIMATASTLVIPKGVTHISEEAFSRNPSDYPLQISVEEGNPVYDSRGDCNAIIETATNTLVYGTSKTVIPNSVTSIGKGAFKGCSLTSIVIPGSVKVIGERAFFGVPLKEMTVEKGVQVIEKEAFCCCSFRKVELPDGVKEIGDDAFSLCLQLVDVSVGKGIKSIGDRAFSNVILESHAKLMSTTLKEKNPPKISKKSFPRRGTIEIPKGSIERYEKDSVWSDPELRLKLSEKRFLDAIPSKQTKAQIIRMKYLDQWFQKEKLTMDEICDKFKDKLRWDDFQSVGISSRTIRNDIRHMEEIFGIVLCEEGRMDGHTRRFFYDDPTYTAFSSGMDDDTIKELRDIVITLSQVKCSASQSKKLADAVQRIQKIIDDQK